MELFRLLGSIAIDNTNANRAINETADRADEGSKKTTSAFKKIGEVGSKVATGLGVAGALAEPLNIKTGQSFKSTKRNNI